MPFKYRLNSIFDSVVDRFIAAGKTSPKNVLKSHNNNAIVTKIINEFKDQNRADIDKWRRALRAASQPEDPRQYILQDLFDNLSADGHYISQLNLRKSATLCSDFSIIDRKSGDVDDEKTELLRTEWFFKLVSNCLDSITMGYTLLELANPETFEFTLIPRRNLQPKLNRVLLEAAGDKFIDYSKGFETRLIHAGEPDKLGLLADLCGQLIWKRNAQQSWAEYTEKYAQPLITITTGSTNQSEMERLNRLLVELGEAARGLLPVGSTIDVKQLATGDAYDVYDKLIERANSEIGKPLTGGTMVSDNGSSRSQSEVHERNLEEKLVGMDKRMIEFIVNGQLLPIMQAWGQNVNPETDKFNYEASFDITLTDHWNIVNSALYHFDIPEKWISKRFNMPIDGKKEQPTFQQQQPITAELKRGGFSANFR